VNIFVCEPIYQKKGAVGQLSHECLTQLITEQSWDRNQKIAARDGTDVPRFPEGAKFSLQELARGETGLEFRRIRGRVTPFRLIRMADAEESDLEDQLDAIDKLRLADSSRATYAAKMAQITIFVSKTYPQHVAADNTVDFTSIPVDVFRHFLMKKQEGGSGISALKVCLHLIQL
jgi:hypothetical protein